MYTLACVLKTDGRFLPKDVALLEEITSGDRICTQFVCLTDSEITLKHVQIRPLFHINWRWPWTKLELFRPGLFKEGERLVYMDLRYADIERKAETLQLLDRLKTAKDPLLLLPPEEDGAICSTRAMSFKVGMFENVYMNFGRTFERVVNSHKDETEWLRTTAGSRLKILEPIGV